MITGYGRFAPNRDDVGGMLDGISAVLGALVVVTPFLCLDTGNAPAAASAFGCGFAVMGLAYLDGPEPESWMRWASGVLGAWVTVSPWILQRALVSPDAVLAPPMSEPAVSMPVVLGVGIVVAAALDIIRTAVERGRTLPTATALVPAKRPVPAFPVETQRPIHPTEA
jgi:urea transporter